MASETNKRYHLHQFSSSSNYTYDVFLSFKGEDTRKNFVDHLYLALNQSGIHTFMHDHELPIGNDRYLEIPKAIQESRISIIVFSKNYAFSGRCLDELVKILDCKEYDGQVVLPVYYNIDPAQIREQTMTFGCGFGNYDKALAMDIKTAERWRAGLAQVANLSGWDLQNIANGHEAKFIKEIVGHVHNIVKHKRLHVAKYPVGLELHVKHLNSVLLTGSNEVKLVGIYGMGGIGKTTIAKAFYNSCFHLFEGSCFLADVREVSEQPNGLARLQEQLLSKTLTGVKLKIPNEHIGVTFLKETLCHKRVLIVLDDIEQLGHLECLAGDHQWFGLGSRIVITTRDENFLRQAKVSHKYEVKPLNKHDSMRLFSWHAFGKPDPIVNYRNLSEEIVHYCNGLPLALEVLGASLLGQTSKELWSSTLQKLRKIPPHQILKKLRISFDTLDDDKIKDIFLDIACFFIGMEKDYAIDIFDGCGFFPVVGITILIDRCLLKISEKHKLIVMHDLVRDMGREVVREKFPFEPGKRSRVWFHEDATRVVSKEEGSKAIEGLVLNQPNPMHLNTKTFAIMQKLRLLQINNVHLHGSFQGLFTELRWLCWHHCPLESLPTDLHPKKLVALDMQHSNLKTWNGMKFLTNLKRLNLSDSKFLRTTLDFSGVPKLNELSLRFCSSLLEIDPSIGHLCKLTELNLGHCENLKTLPKSICNLRSLERLYLDECTKLDNLPEEVGNMESLQELHAPGTAIKKLPDSIGLLKQLRNVSLAQSSRRSTKAKAWFSFFPFQTSTQTKTEIKFLPPTVSTLSSTKDMDLSDSNLSDADIPHDLSQLSLRLLHLNGNKFRNIPSRLSQLCSLQHLWLNDCALLQSIAEFPPNIITLDVSNCPLLERLPDLSNLKYLECLDLSKCSRLVALQGLHNIKSILEIYLEGCSNLTTSLEESLLRGYSKRLVNCSIFLSRREIPCWFDHIKVGSFISFNVPTDVETEFLEMTLWVDYVHEGKDAVLLQAVIKNKTNETEWTYEARFVRTFEVNSWVSNGPQPYPIRGGDKIEVNVVADKGLKIEKCGVHLVYKKDIKTITQHSQAMDFIHEMRGDVPVQTSLELSNENQPSKRLKLE